MSTYVLFVHDHKFLVDGSAVFSEGKITSEVLDRYVQLAPKVRVLARKVPTQDGGRLNRLDRGFVEFSFVKGVLFSDVFLRHFLGNVRSALKLVAGARCCVLRLPSFLGVLGWALCVLTRRPYFVEVVGDASESLRHASSGGGWVRPALIRVFDFLTARAIRNAWGAIYVTERYLQARYPTRGIESFASNVEMDLPVVNPYEAFPVRDGGKIRIGSIGSYSNESKGYRVAIHAIRVLRDAGVDCELRILGSGDRSNYERLATGLGIGGLVFFDGSLPSGGPVAAWLDSLDFYVQPSLGGEGLPRAVLEAMSRGLPVIGTNVSGIPEVVAPELLVSPGDVHGLAERMLELAKNQSSRSTFSHVSYSRASDFQRSRLAIRRSVFWAKAASLLQADP